MTKKKETTEETTGAAEELVTVKALCHIGEGGVHYKPGDTFEVSASRAEALGNHVEVAEAAKTEL